MEIREADWDGIWEVLGCKWTFQILRLLVRQEARFNEIKNAIEGLPASTLSKRLESLQAENIVEREVGDDSPPTVTYSLTEKGKELGEIILRIEDLERNYE